MKFQINKFKKIHSDQDHTILKHEDGHEIRIQHKNISPRFRSEIESVPSAQTMVKGGEVYGQSLKTVSEHPPGSIPKQEPPALTQDINIPENQAGEERAIQKIKSYPNTLEELHAQQAQGLARGGRIQKMADAGPVVNISDEAPDFSKLQNKKEIDPEIAAAYERQQEMQRNDPQAVASNLSNLAGSKSPIQQVSDTEDQNELQGPANMPQQQAPQQQNGLNMNTGSNYTMAGIGEQLAGLQGQQAAEQQMAKEAQPLKESQAAYQDMLSNHYNNLVTDQQRDLGAAIDDMKAGHIDPSRVWNDKGAFGKVSTALGLLLGGMGGGILGQENPALKFLQHQIDNDVLAQSRDMLNKQSIYHAMSDKYKDQVSALGAAKVMQTAAVIGQLDAIAAKYQSPMLQSKYQQLRGQLMQSVAPNINNVALRQMALGNSSVNSNPDQYMNYLKIADPKTYETMQKSYVPGVGFSTIDIPDKAREEISARHALDNSIQNLRNFANKNAGSINPVVMREGLTLARLAQDQYRRANNQGVFREAEAKFVNGIVNQNPTAFFNNIRVQPQYRALEQDNQAQLNNLNSTYGIRGTVAPQHSGGYKPMSFKPLGR